MESKRSNSFFPWLVCGLGALFYCYEYVLRISPSVMTQQLAHSFNINAAMLGNMIAFYYYAYTPMQLPVGVLMDRYGPRKLLGIAALICAAGSYIFAHGSLGFAEVGRFFVGFGSAFAFVGVLKLASLWLPPSRFAMIAGMVTTLGMFGATFGDVLLGQLVQKIGWRLTIDGSAIVGLFIAALIWFKIPETDHSPIQAPATPLSYSDLFKEFFLLIKKPSIWLAGMVGFCLYLPTSAFAELWGVPYLERAYSLSNVGAAEVVSMIFLGWAVGGPIMGWVSDRSGKRNLPIVIGALLAALIVSVILYMPHVAGKSLFIFFFLLGVFSSVENIVFAVAREHNHPRLVGTAMAVTNMLIMLGGMLFQPLIGVFLDRISGSTVKGDISVYSGHDFQLALVVLPVCLIIGAVLILFVKEVNVAENGKDVKNFPNAISAALAD